MVYYIYHSAFAVELEKNILIFDFYKIPENKKMKENDFYERFVKREDKQVFVFSTHSHSDHFNPKILEWEKLNNRIIYILSDDIKISASPKNTYFTKEGDELEISYKLGNNLENEKIKVYTFGSTDLGSSFYINIEDKNIFHAGDLHFWHWEDDTESEERAMKNAYLEQLNKIKTLPKIDIAFTAVDPRLGVNVYEGVELFWDLLKPKIIIPMHFSDDYSAMKTFKEKFKAEKVKIIEIDDSMKEIME
ncbi:MBL fold metallo-hydrolase [Fusobacterium russii]|uniref:MBL fold metallo-hydrolase n=1 Tax=Fusobacterium russii TaxID=854 RepID=UPI00039B5CFE|nr:MBL fold metallo-hydrolase [Fusobacterium russii]